MNTKLVFALVSLLVLSFAGLVAAEPQPFDETAILAEIKRDVEVLMYESLVGSTAFTAILRQGAEHLDQLDVVRETAHFQNEANTITQEVCRDISVLVKSLRSATPPSNDSIRCALSMFRAKTWRVMWLNSQILARLRDEDFSAAIKFRDFW